jgi:two-component system C4-dicarboxylate transport response regulator DctD
MTASTDIILVDDDANVLDACRELLEIEGFRVSAHGSVAAALSGLQADSEAVIVSDVRMPQQDGFDLLAAVRYVVRSPIAGCSSKTDVCAFPLPRMVGRRG